MPIALSRPAVVRNPSQKLTKRYERKPVLDEVGFTVLAGEVVALIGPSDAGKTTLFRCLARLVEANDGDIHLFGDSMRSMRAGELRRARRNIGLVFQQHNLIRRRLVVANVLAGRLGHAPIWRVIAERFEKADRQRAYPALDRVALLEFADRRADRLSGGQQQRVAIARVLTQESHVILADEPVASLDPAAAVSVLSLLRDIAHEDSISVLWQSAPGRPSPRLRRSGPWFARWSTDNGQRDRKLPYIVRFRSDGRDPDGGLPDDL